MFKWLKVKLGLDWYTEYVPMKLSNKGFPPDNLKHKDAFPLADLECAFTKPGIMTIKVAPKTCPKCHSGIVSRGHDWWNIEDSGQYMVWTHHCPNGHGFAVNVA